MYFGDHNALCLAHGRRPLIEYKSLPFPRITSPPQQQNGRENSKCRGAAADPRPPMLLRPLLQAAGSAPELCSLRTLTFLTGVVTVRTSVGLL